MQKELNPLLLQRRSIFAFSDIQIEEQDIMLLFDAARKAPSSFNAQPWRFIYAVKSNPEEYNEMYKLLFEGNKIWAKSAPVLIMALTENILQHNGEVNGYALHDLGLATANLLLQASFMGLSTHPMGGFDKIKAMEILNIPGNIEPATIIALGYKGKSKNLPDNIKERIKSAGKRKKLNEFVFKGMYNQKIL